MGQRRIPFVIYAVCSLSLALLWHPDVWYYLRHDFVGKDTIFNLALIEQLGLALTTFILVACLLWANQLKSRIVEHATTSFLPGSIFAYAAPVVDFFVTLLLFVFALAAAPQILYFYYMQLFEGLPLQWVGMWPNTQQVQKFLMMKPIDSLNTLMSGLSLWSMIAGVLLFWLYRYTHSLRLRHRVTVNALFLSAASLVLIGLPDLTS